ncbi:MAG: calcium-translocating P-type ATPase, PMCA-type [bacterium]
MSSTVQEGKKQLYIGLTPDAIEVSRKKHGSNVLTPPRRDPWWRQYLKKFEDPVIRILVIAAFLAIGVGIVDGHYIEGIGIVMAILLSTTLAFLNEYAAGQKFDVLNKVSDDIPAKVVRDSNFVSIPRRDLVVGDILFVETGEEIPGDGTILEAISLQVDESRMTGESAPVHKQVLDPHLPHADENAYPLNKLLRGSFVRDGYGYIEITAVGDRSEIGQAARAAAEVTDEKTPLNRQLERLSKIIGLVGFTVAVTIYAALVARSGIKGELVLSFQQWMLILVLSLSVLLAMMKVWVPMIFDGLDVLGKPLPRIAWLEVESPGAWLKTVGLGIGFFAVAWVPGTFFGFIPPSPADWIPPHVGLELLRYFMISVTIIVVAVPEGLPMSVTLSLAYSMQKMAAANNLVRHLHACETIGAATVICSDKTGTLTQNKMKVQNVHFSFLPQGAFTDKEEGFGEILVAEAISGNTTAQLSRTEGGPSEPIGNPTEGSLLLWLEEQGVDYQTVRNSFPVIRQWTFTTERKFMGTMGISEITGKQVLHVKGAPEIVMALCSQILTPNGPEPIREYEEKLHARLKTYQSRGMRTLAFAYGEAEGESSETALEDAAVGLYWLGFAAIADPVREDVPAAVQACREAGIMVKMITGDTAETAREISRKIGLVDAQETPDCFLTGPEFGALDDSQAELAAMKMKVLSRARPLDKLRVVKLLQKANQVVAVTGDGTNDAPALNHADVGLAMGKSGTAVAKEASDIILLDDSFTSIVNAVMWGRSLYENIQRFVLFQLTINVAALSIAFLGPFIGIKLPLTVIQMLWVNLIMDTFAALALATEPPHRNVLSRPPRNPGDFIVSRSMAIQILLTAAAFFGFLVWYLVHIQRDGQVTDYEISLFFTTFVLLQFWNLFNARCLGQTHSALKGLFQNRLFLLVGVVILAGQVAIVQWGGEMFRTVPLSLKDWAFVFGGTSVVLWAGEIHRWVKRIKA